MSYRSQRSSRRSSGRGRGKVHHEKSKRKARKHRSRNQQTLEASDTLCLEEIAKKILERLSNLGIQTFAFSPFSQYFRDWLLSLKNVISEFESNPNVKADEEFIEKRSQLISDIELNLSERQREEDVLENATRMLTKQRNLLVQTKTEFSYTLQKPVSERKSEIRSISTATPNIPIEVISLGSIRSESFPESGPTIAIAIAAPSTITPILIMSRF